MDFTVMVSFITIKIFSAQTVKFIFLFVDINECRVGSHSCSTSSDCSNTIGSFECKCKFGFTGNGFVCKGEFFLISKSCQVVSNVYVVSRF